MFATSRAGLFCNKGEVATDAKAPRLSKNSLGAKESLRVIALKNLEEQCSVIEKEVTSHTSQVKLRYYYRVSPVTDDGFISSKSCNLRYTLFWKELCPHKNRLRHRVVYENLLHI